MREKIGIRNPQNKVYTKKEIAFVHYKNIKEFIDLLRLIWSSNLAVHTEHDNEVTSIVEKLGEEGIVHQLKYTKILSRL